MYKRQPYATEKGAFRNHPCTVWASDFVLNWRWLIRHGLALCEEYSHRYQKIHTCLNALAHADKIFPYGDPAGRSGKDPKPFARAMPDEFKFDTSIDTFTAYRMYISHPNLGLHLIIFVTHPENQIGYK